MLKLVHERGERKRDEGLQTNPRIRFRRTGSLFGREPLEAARARNSGGYFDFVGWCRGLTHGRAVAGERKPFGKGVENEGFPVGVPKHVTAPTEPDCQLGHLMVGVMEFGVGTTADRAWARCDFAGGEMDIRCLSNRFPEFTRPLAAPPTLISGVTGRTKPLVVAVVKGAAVGARHADRHEVEQTHDRPSLAAARARRKSSALNSGYIP